MNSYQKQNINLVLDLKDIEKHEDKFIHNQMTNQLLFNEVIKSTATSNWPEFLRLCKLPLPWIEEYIDLNQNKWCSFLTFASKHFPDKYVNKIINTIALTYNSEELSDNSSINYQDLIENLLSRGLMISFENLKTNNYINSTDIITTLIYNYGEDNLKLLSRQLLKNNDIVSLLIENKKSQINLYSLFTKNYAMDIIEKNKCLTQIFNINAFLIDIEKYYPQDKMKVGEALFPFLFTLYSSDTNKSNYVHIKSVYMKCLIEGFVDINSLYLEKENKFVKEKEEVEESVLTYSLFHLSPSEILRCKAERQEYLEKLLPINPIKKVRIKI